MFFQNKREILSFLTERKAYPFSRKGKVFFRPSLPDLIKKEIVEKLGLNGEEDCQKIRRAIKEKVGKEERHRPIKEWVKEERPRELLLAEGAERLPLAKLLAIILRTGSEGKSAEDLARELLNRFRSLRGIDTAPISSLQEISGMGIAKCAGLKAALELGKRLLRESAPLGERIRDAASAIRYVKDYFGPYLRDAKKESFCVIFLDSRNKVLETLEVSKGGIDSSVVDKAEIVREASLASARAVIIVHNHPSGEAYPSKEDITITKEILKALEIVGIKLLDHIIIGRNEENCFSFLNEGLI